MHRILLTLLISSSLLARAAAVDLTSAADLQRARKWEKARAAYLALLPQLKGDERANALNKIGVGYERDRGQLDKSIAYHKQAIEVEGASSTSVALAWLRIGYCLKMRRDFTGAIKAYEEVEKLEGVNPQTAGEALLFKAWSYNSLERPDDVIKTVHQLHRIEGLPPHTAATGYYTIGRIYERKTMWKEALAAYEAVVSSAGTTGRQRGAAAGRISELKLIMLGDLPFYIQPFVIGVTSEGATIRWVAQGETRPAEVVAGGRVVASEVVPVKETVCHMHSATLTGFQPGHEVAYEVRAGGETHKGTFKTAPPPGTPVTFAATGDTQGAPELHRQVARSIARFEPDFMIHVGDLTDRGNEWGRWRNELLEPGIPYLNQAVFVPSIGNHDGGPYYPLLFDARERSYYSFTYGDVFVAVLDSYGKGTSRKYRQAQLDWLEAELSASRARWKVISLHVPMMASDGNNKWFGKDDFHPLLEKYEVDLVVCGHHPIYRRYLPIGEPGQHPILHITTGGGGPVGSPVPSPLLVQGGDTQHFTVFKTTPTSLEMTACDGDGAVIDTLTLTKDADGGLPAAYVSSSVPLELGWKIRHLYQELLTPGSWDLQLNISSLPEPGQSVNFELDLASLPRGGINRDELPEHTCLTIDDTENSPWTVPHQSLDLALRRHKIQATAPGNLVIGGGGFSPPLEVSMNIQVGDRTFIPTITEVRLHADSRTILSNLTQPGSLPIQWDFKQDPEDKGVAETWFTDAQGTWDSLLVTKVWEEQLPEAYDGVAWYRTTFTNPGLAADHRLWLTFGAVDESCRVYLNGRLVDDQVYDSKIDDGAWEKPRRFDVSDALQDGKNLLVVRVEDNFGLGGIYRGAVLSPAPTNPVPTGTLATLDWQGAAPDGVLRISNGKFVGERSLVIEHNSDNSIVFHRPLSVPAGGYTGTLRYRANPHGKGRALALYLKQGEATYTWPISRKARDWAEMPVELDLGKSPVTLQLAVDLPGTYELDELTLTPVR